MTILGGLESLEIGDGYSTTYNDLLNDFYIPCLQNSISYKRRAGYFNSGLIAIAPLAFANFVKNGGRMQLICNPSLKESDYEAIMDSEGIFLKGKEKSYEDLLALYHSDGLGNSLVNALSSLIASKIIDLKILVKTNQHGIFHDKLGIFSDGKNEVSFAGGANETAAAWLKDYNHENFEVFCSWKDESEIRRISRHKTEFELMWNVAPVGFEFVSPSEVRDLVYKVAPPGEPEISLEQIRKEIQSKSKKSIKTFSSDKSYKSLQEHQISVINNWKISGNKGIICFATGGGKTLTAISIIREHINENKPVLVLVPSLLLQKQWQSEIESEIENPNIILFGGGFSALRRESILRESSSNGNNIILSTFQTAISKSFMRSIRLHDDLLIIADEVHTAGQPEFKKFLDMDFDGPRLGLSATPERFGDAEGTDRIFRFFGEKLQPFFTIADAIKAGRLVPYEYEFEEISLTQIEYDEWLEITKKIGMVVSMSEDKKNNQALERLLQMRANIVKEAENKIGYVVKILNANFQIGDRWLIYCNNQYQLKSVRNALTDFGEKVYDYHIAMPGSKDETLQFFSDNGGIMLAINCLDEGVDIPQINKAIIIASSTNPRQFIQRRGRVLRSFKDKYKAKIWDVLVTNPKGDLLTVSEAKRALIFAQTSESAITKVKLANLIESTNIAELITEIGDNEN
jgi:superfamily II DNA or RNA helicase